MKDLPTQNKLLQEPPATIEEAVVISRRFEAANSMMATLRWKPFKCLDKCRTGQLLKLCMQTSLLKHVLTVVVWTYRQGVPVNK